MPSKYTLVHLAARRAREVNAYYHSLGEGLGRYTPPLVDQVASNKPLSIALEEIAAGKLVAQEPGEAMRVAEQLLGGLEEGEVLEGLGEAEEDDHEADIVELESLGQPEDDADADAPGADVPEAEAGDEADAPDEEH